MRKLVLCLLAGLLAASALPAAAQAGGRVCAGPTKLEFERKPGAAAGVLTWKAPRGAKKGVRYRVYRDNAVIGQTKKRRMRVRVSVDVRYRFAVRVVSRSGRPLPCAAGVRRLVSYVAPKTPRNLAVTGANGPAAHLQWSRARGGDAKVRAYRVLRGDATYKQITGTEIDVPISNDRSYKFAVQSVDERGKVSAPSRAVTIDSGHHAPPAPANVIASDISDSEVTISWSASRPARGLVTGYRVFRDGRVVRQVKGLSTRITGLGAGASHAFTVAAVDSAGWLSAQSRPALVNTAPPIPSTGNAHAFLLASTGRSFADFREHYRQIGVVHPTYFDCSGDGRLTGKDDPQISRWTQQRAVKLLPRFNCQREEIVARIVNDGQLREQWIGAMVQSVEQHGYDGLNLDFEKGRAADRNAYTSFVAELGSRLHARGKLLSVAVSSKTWDAPNHPRSTFFDYAALAQHADYVFIMAWGIHWQTSGPGALDDIRWFRGVADYAASLPNRERFVLGTALYGLDWKNGGGSANPAVPYEHADMQQLIARLGVTPRRDATTDNWTFSYREGGEDHEVWYVDAATTHERMRLARERGLGVGFWRLGSEDQSMWGDPLIGG
jgi:spore germination protein YaaH